jgi:uncharacterized membrane protein
MDERADPGRRRPRGNPRRPRRPLALIPENTLKFIVGIALTSLGTFWAAEGAGVHWPADIVSLLPIAAVYLVGALVAVATLRGRAAAQTGGGR